MSVTKRLIKHGNSQALVIDKAVLAAAGISEGALFLITVNPNGGLIIQSVGNDPEEMFDTSFRKLNDEYSDLMQRLADL